MIKRDGAITKVAGDPAHPIPRGPLCGKCSIAYNGAWRDEGQRLLHPLRRAGPKGSGTFEPISWEEALREIAGKLTVLRDSHGAETIFHTHYTGTCSLIAGDFPCRFFERLGATEVSPDTADYADIVLPAASFLEFDDLSSSYFELIIGPQVKCQEPLGQSLPNQEIFRRLARAMGFEDSPLYEDDQTMIDEALRACGAGLDWETLKEKGWAYVSEAPLILWAEDRFPTPSGKIEIASSRAEADGHPRVPQPSVDAPPAEGRLRLLSPADKWLMNSSYGNDPKILKAMGPATVVIHPDDAAARGIGGGDPVRLADEACALTFVAKVSDIITPGALLTTKSRWPKWSEGAANVNLLHRARKTDMGESTAVHATEVTIALAAPS